VFLLDSPNAAILPKYPLPTKIAAVFVLVATTLDPNTPAPVLTPVLTPKNPKLFVMTNVAMANDTLVKPAKRAKYFSTTVGVGPVLVAGTEEEGLGVRSTMRPEGLRIRGTDWRIMKPDEAYL